MTNTTTTTNTTLFVGGANLMETNKVEFVAFIMDKKNKFTVAMVESELTKLNVAFAARATKEAKAELLFDELIKLTVAAEEEDFIAEMEELRGPKSETVEVNGPVGKLSAAGETLVAEENNQTQIEEEIKMTNEQTVANELMEAQKRQNQKAMESSRILKNEIVLKGAHSEYVNPISTKVNAQIRETVNRFYSNLGEFRVEIIRVVPVNNDRFGRVGYVDVKLPPAFAMVGIWNDEAKKKEWYDMVEFNYNQMVRREKWAAPYNAMGMVYNLELGSGVIRLAIREDASNEVYVRMPMDKGKEEGVFFDVFRTSNIQWGRPNSANNGNLEAALTAALRFYWKELKMENTENRNDFDASCMNCRHMQWFGMKDGVNDDLDTENPKNTRILNQPDVETLAQHGSHITQGFCTKRKFFVDADAVEMINALSAEERRYYDVEVIDEVTGEVRIEQRFQRADEVLVAGKPVKIRDIRVESTRETCRTCPFYHKNSYKGEEQVGKEIVEAREKLASKAKSDSERQAANSARVFVNEYWTTRARAGRQAFETLVDKGDGAKWMVGFPAQVTDNMEHVMDIRVSGIGVNVYFGDELMGSMENTDFAFVPEVETFDAKEAAFNKMVGMVYYAAFNRDKMSKDRFELVSKMVFVDGMPEGYTARHQERWDNAVHWFEQSLEWAAERVAAQSRPDFSRKFYAGIAGYMAAKGLTETPDLMALGVKELHIEDVMFETITRIVDGALLGGYEHMFEEFGLEKGYEDLEAKDFIRFLDESAIETVLDAMVDGSEFVIVGGKELVKSEEEAFAQEFHGVEDKYAKTAESVLSDAGLVADALQIMLQRQVNGLLYGVNRSEDKVEAFTELNVCEDALMYIAQHAGLLK